MSKKTFTATGFVHKFYEHFLNSYKTFVVASSRLHVIDSVQDLQASRVSVYVVVRSMDGV